MIMKRFCLVLLLILVAFNVRGQGENQLNDIIISSIKTQMYDDSVRFHARNPDKKEKFSYRYNICVDRLPRSFPYDSLKNAYFYTSNNPSSLTKSKRRELRKGSSIQDISIRVLDDKIIIVITPLGAKLKRNKWDLSVSIWFIYTYAYSQEQKKWILINKEEGGI